MSSLGDQAGAKRGEANNEPAMSMGERIARNAGSDRRAACIFAARELSTAARTGDESLAAEMLAMALAHPVGSLRLARQTALEHAFANAASAGSLGVLKMIAEHVDPKAKNSLALRAAAKNGRLDCAQFLVVRSGPASEITMALAAAAGAGHLDCVRALLPHSQAELEHSQALTVAAKGGWAECVKALLEESRPSDELCQAIAEAACSGHVDCLGLIEPAASEGQRMEALKHAAGSGHLEAALLLRQRHMERGGRQRPLNEALCLALAEAARQGRVECVQGLLPFFRPPKGWFSLGQLSAEIREGAQRGGEHSGRQESRLLSAGAIDAFVEKKELQAMSTEPQGPPKASAPRL